ncbi:MAG: signal peptide peptidase SppA [Gammaproteobacteria bacterium]|nr:signal peptide peptidase SppA [Gammaproteobacteria bacterium]
MSQDNNDPWLAQQPVDNAAAAATTVNQQQAGTAAPTGGVPVWERQLIEKLATHGLKEQRRSRRWGIFFKSLFFGYLLLVLILYWPNDIDGGVGHDHVAQIDIHGVIADDAEANADSLIKALQDAFEDKHAKAVMLRINSPGGSPVQAGYVYDEIRRLRAIHPDKKLYAVVTDICASGGYYIASAADYIYADKASMVGSIGVLMNGFGFVDTMNKLGVERRLLTAGENKGMLDPFQPLSEKHKQYVQTMLDKVHQQFIAVVKQGRGARLHDNPEIFSGLIWTGEQALELGLIDGLGSNEHVARDIIKVDDIVDYTVAPPLLDRLVGQMGVSMSSLTGSLAARMF